jgi:hypothetical protein
MAEDGSSSLVGSSPSSWLNVVVVVAEILLGCFLSVTTIRWFFFSSWLSRRGCDLPHSTSSTTRVAESVGIRWGQHYLWPASSRGPEVLCVEMYYIHRVRGNRPPSDPGYGGSDQVME